MASADQLKALLKSHVEGDDQRFFSVAMQLAAHEAKLGHGKLAEELRAIIDKAKRCQAARSARYALIVSIRAPEIEIDLYNAISNKIATIVEL